MLAAGGNDDDGDAGGCECGCCDAEDDNVESEILVVSKNINDDVLTERGSREYLFF